MLDGRNSMAAGAANTFAFGETTPEQVGSLDRLHVTGSVERMADARTAPMIEFVENERLPFSIAIFGALGESREAQAGLRAHALSARWVSWRLFLIPLLAILVWLLVPLHYQSCQGQLRQDARVFVGAFRPLYMLAALGMGEVFLDMMVATRPKGVTLFFGMLAMCIDTFLVYLVVASVDETTEIKSPYALSRERLLMLGSVVVSASTFVVGSLGWVFLEGRWDWFDRCRLSFSWASCLTSCLQRCFRQASPAEQRAQSTQAPATASALVSEAWGSEVDSPVIDDLEDHSQPRPPAKAPATSCRSPRLCVVRELTAPVEPAAAHTSARRASSNSQPHVPIAHRRLSVRRVILAVMVCAIVLISFFVNVLFASLFNDITGNSSADTATRQVLSVIYVAVLSPALETMALRAVDLMEHNSSFLLLRLIMWYTMNMFFNCFYRTVIMAQYRSVAAFLVVEAQVIVLELFRFPLRIPEYYRSRETRLLQFMGDYAQYKTLALSGLVLGVCSYATAQTQSTEVAVLTTLGTFLSAVGIRVGLNMGRLPPQRKSNHGQPPSKHLRGMKEISVLPVSVRSDMGPEDLEHKEDNLQGEDPVASAMSGVVPPASFKANYPDDPGMSAQPPTSPITPALSEDCTAQDDPGDEPSMADRSIFMGTPKRTKRLPLRRAHDTFEHYVREFQRATATEHFLRKRARQLALFAYLCFVPLLHHYYNSDYWPFATSTGFDSAAVDRSLLFSVIAIAIDVFEFSVSRYIFNTTLRVDTFVDAMSICRVIEVPLLFTSIHVLSDVYLTLNSFRFCDVQ